MATLRSSETLVTTYETTWTAADHGRTSDHTRPDILSHTRWKSRSLSHSYPLINLGTGSGLEPAAMQDILQLMALWPRFPRIANCCSALLCHC
jgi:hypothetical protein